MTMTAEENDKVMTRIESMAATISDLKAKNKELLGALERATIELRQEIEGQYGNYKDHSVNERRFNRDISPVIEFEALINKYRG